MNLGSFQIQSVIVHEIPRGNDDEEDLVFTDTPIELDEDLRRYFHNKIVTSLKERGIEVVADPAEDDAVREAVAAILKSPRQLTRRSRDIAKRLDEVQTGVNPPGLLAVVSGTVDGDTACVSVLKLEREQGLRFRFTQVNGKRVVDLQHLRDLTLTDKTKVFKTSLLVVDGATTAGNIVGRVSDDQRGRYAGTGVATFFLGTFLGCSLRDSPAKATLEFAEAAMQFINHAVDSAERKGRYQVALLAALQDNQAELRPRAFANQALEADDRPQFFRQLGDAGIDHEVAFPKDISLVRVEGFRMVFESGMVLVGKRDDIEEGRVDIRPSTAPRQGVDINDPVKTLQGR